MIDTLPRNPERATRKIFFSLKFVVSFLSIPEYRKNGCIIKEKTPTLFRNYRPSAKGLHLIDTFSISTGEKPGRYLIPYFSGFCPAWTIREHYYDTKTLGKNKTSAVYNLKPFLTKIIVLLFATFIENYYLWVLKIKR